MELGEFLQFPHLSGHTPCRRDAVRLNGQRLRILINDDAMRYLTLPPLLVGEMNQAGNQFLIKLSWLRAFSCG